jgi:hypothetical protein
MIWLYQPSSSVHCSMAKDEAGATTYHPQSFPGLGWIGCVFGLGDIYMIKPRAQEDGLDPAIVWGSGIVFSFIYISPLRGLSAAD